MVIEEKTEERWLRKLKTVPRGLTEVGQRLLYYLSLMRIESHLPIDVVIPVAEKDLDVLPYAIDGIRMSVRHPIMNLWVIAPVSRGIQVVCRRKGCSFVDERSVVDTEPGSIGLVVNGNDRSRWIYQQFLKWNADCLGDSSHFLVVDADTVLVRPQVYERDGKVTFHYSDERHQPYYEMYSRLLNETVLCPMSFVSHQMLFEKQLLRELKGRIENIHGCDWRTAILQNLDRAQVSGFSDYDTYGHYAFLHHPERMAIEYWCNLSVTRKMLRNVRTHGAAVRRKVQIHLIPQLQEGVGHMSATTPSPASANAALRGPN